MKKLTAFLLLLIFFFLSVPQSFAQIPGLGQRWGNEQNCVTQDGVATLKCIPDVFQNLVSSALTLAGVVAIFLIVYGGIRFVTSGGDPKQVEGARAIITWAIVGLVFVFLSFFIINVVGFLTNTSCIESFGFSSCT